MKAMFVEVDGTSTRVLTAGRPGQPALLLIHGFGGTADIWIRNIDALGERHHVIAPDLIGNGFSRSDVLDAGGPPQPVMLRHLVRLLDVLGVDRFAASGTSYGALLAALLHFELPARVTHLLINGSANCFNPEPAFIESLKRLETIYRPFVTSPDLEGCRDTLRRIVYDPDTVPEEILPVMLTAYSQPWMLAAWTGALRGLMDVENGRRYRILDRLERIAVPTLLLWGHDDIGAPFEHAQAAARRIPGARLIGFRHCGHKPMLEHAPAYNADVLAFLAT